LVFLQKLYFKKDFKMNHASLMVPRDAAYVGEQTKKAVYGAGRLVTVSRVKYGNPVSDPSKVAFGHVNTMRNYAGFLIGGTLPLDTSLFPWNNNETSRITGHKMILNDSLMQVIHVTTESNSIYELHVVK
jgi:hypothetical protein